MLTLAWGAIYMYKTEVLAKDITQHNEEAWERPG